MQVLNTDQPLKATGMGKKMSPVMNRRWGRRLRASRRQHQGIRSCNKGELLMLERGTYPNRMKALPNVKSSAEIADTREIV